LAESPATAENWWRVKVPASSANLGPGFDALGLALSVYLTCRFRKAAELRLTATGRDAGGISLDTTNLIWQTALRVSRDCGEVLPNAEIEIHNEIPLGKGLGSSAAALTAGVIIADKLLGLNWKPLRILNEAAHIEGHPDNVAACVLGSVVASAIDAGGAARAVRIDLPERFQVAVVVPDFVLPTHESRKALPEAYGKSDVVFNVQRSALLIAALASGNVSAFPTALEDRLHQPYRAKLVPGLDEILRLRAPGLLGCTLSGAGPSVLVFHEKGHDDVCELVRQIFGLNGRGSEVLAARVDTHGYTIEEDHRP
jgi:homoserine kinase